MSPIAIVLSYVWVKGGERRLLLVILAEDVVLDDFDFSDVR